MRTPFLVLALLLTQAAMAAQVQVVEMVDGRELHAYIHDDDRGDDRFRKIVLLYQGKEMGAQRIRWSDVARVRDLTPEEIAEHQESVDVVAEAPVAKAPAVETQAAPTEQRLEQLRDEIRSMRAEAEGLTAGIRERSQEMEAIKADLVVSWARSQDWSELPALEGFPPQTMANLNAQLSRIRSVLATPGSSAAQIRREVLALFGLGITRGLERAGCGDLLVPEHLR